jgi:NAD(P)-dependent dehydrogenase (short-subunit alcohol dehydrogenase family)
MELSMKVERLFSLEGKVAVVTGSSRNIGLAIADAFADAGGSVVMAARREPALAEAAGGVRQRTGARVEYLACDVATLEGTDALAEFVHDQFGCADILVNNAYFGGDDTLGVDILEIDDDSWQRAFATNVMGPYRLCRSIGRFMRAGRGGSIINVLSGSGFLPNRGLTPYGSTKAALWMMTRYLATELAPTIRVNGLVPGFTAGPSVDATPQETYDEFISLIPMKRPGQASEVAPAAVYLASDAASYTTGTVLFTNGGRPW